MRINKISKIIATAFFSGALSVISQSLLIRELLVIFQGNEITISLMLSQWLAGGMAGSYAVARLRPFNKYSGRSGLRATLLALALVVAAMYFFIRFYRPLLGLMPGQTISLGGIFAGSLIVLFLPGWLMGAQYSFAVKWLKDIDGKNPGGRVFLWESLGCLLGGIFFTLGLYLDANTAAMVLGVVLLTSLAQIILTEKRSSQIIFCLMAIVLAVFTPKIYTKMERISLAKLYSGSEISEVKNTPYQQLVMTKGKGQKTLYADGMPVSTLPDADWQEKEEFVTLSLLFHLNPKRILLIGGAGRFIEPILNQGIENLDYLEYDPWLMEMVAKYWPPEGRQILEDRRLKIHNMDGRLFLKKMKNNYDIILIAVPLPYTINFNRFYSKEFYRLCRVRLADNGFLATILPGTGISRDKKRVKINGIILKTAKHIFPQTRIIPGESNLLITGMSPAINDNKMILDNFQKRAGNTKFISQEYLKYRLDNTKEKLLLKEIEMADIAENGDFDPKAMTATLQLWQSMLTPFLNKYYENAKLFIWIIIGLLLVWLLTGSVGPVGTMIGSGVAGMSLQIVALWGLQAVSGSVYYWIALLTALYMSGLSLGSWLGVRCSPEHSQRNITITEMVISIWILCWVIIFRTNIISILLSFILSAGSGFLMGLEFPWLVAKHNEKTKAGEIKSAGSIYSADMLGGWLGALFIGIMVLPFWGVCKTLLVLLILKLITLRWWLSGKKA